MKTIYRFTILSLAASMLFTSCLKDICEETRTFVQMDPMYLSYDEIRTDISTEAPHELENPGKLYVYGQYLFINELEKGVHVYDNSDPSNPINIGFIAIPGNVDIAIKDGFMYADNYMDLVTIDISDPTQSRLVCRDEDVYTSYFFDQTRGIFVGFRETEITAEIDCTDPNFNNDFFRDGNILFGVPEFDSNSAVLGGGRSTGTGGSLARFSIVKGSFVRYRSI